MRMFTSNCSSVIVINESNVNGKIMHMNFTKILASFTVCIFLCVALFALTQDSLFFAWNAQKEQNSSICQAVFRVVTCSSRHFIQFFLAMKTFQFGIGKESANRIRLIVSLCVVVSGDTEISRESFRRR